jgi:5-methylcytosine-specific restriction protein A
MPRREFPAPVRRAAIQRANGECEAVGGRYGLLPGQRCGAVLGPDRAIDHELPDWMGGEPVLENARVVCGACHRIATRGDAADRAKAKRNADRHTGAKAPSRRPMAGSRNTPLKKRLDGTVEPR